MLVVDDEHQIRRALHSILSTRRFDVILAATGEEGIRKAIDAPPDLVILDLALPDMAGKDVCRELRSWLTAPILILTVRSAVTDKIALLDEGADDYLTKPFSAGELLARVRALLRRAGSREGRPPVVTAGELTVDIAWHRATLAGKPVDLTPTEYDILAFLARNADCVVTQHQIIEEVWGPGWGDDTQALRVHMSHLRHKIERDPRGPRFVVTKPGVGFRFSTLASGGTAS